MPTSEAVTRRIRVRVESRYDPARSRPHEGHWFFVYTVRISNESDEAVQLLTRHWIITDSDGRVQHVRGSGVIGQQPRIGPGESFEYSSFCPLRTSFGTMHGSYRMSGASAGQFDVEIAPFALGEPYAIN